MPITQDRMERLLAAGETFELLWRSTLDLAKAEAMRARAGGQSWEQAMGNLLLDMAASPIGDASMVLALERQHYRLTRSRNANNKARSARKRGANGQEPRQDPGLVSDALLDALNVRGRTAEEVAREVDEAEDQGKEGEVLGWEHHPEGGG